MNLILILATILMICPSCSKVAYKERPFSHENKMMICNDYKNNPSSQLRDFIIDNDIVPEVEWYTIESEDIQTNMSVH